jgi:NADH-quinone oxidoreductase subunit A
MLLTLAAQSAGYLHFYAPLVVLLLMAAAFGGGNVLLSRLIGPRRQGPIKNLPYESGMNPFGDTHRRFHVRFYLVAIAFLVFDVEIVFLYPWAITFSSLSSASGLRLLFLGRMLFFVLTSIIAFAYAWRKGVFRYE